MIRNFYSSNIIHTYSINIDIRKGLYAGTVPANKEYTAGLVPANKKYAAGIGILNLLSLSKYKRKPKVSDSEIGSKNKATPLIVALGDENNASDMSK